MSLTARSTRSAGAASARMPELARRPAHSSDDQLRPRNFTAFSTQAQSVERPAQRCLMG
jgi:hypothetical protein